MPPCGKMGRSLALGLRPGQCLPLAPRLRQMTTGGGATTAPPPAADPPPPPPPGSQPPSSSPNPAGKSPSFEVSPDTAARPWAESRLLRAGTPPVGSRRRRIALRTRANIPFELLPYQCFQEARKILREDREEKIAAIDAQHAKIAWLESQPAEKVGGPYHRDMRLRGMRDWVGELKILADVNDPEVKRRFEDGLGDMNKPIYRHLARRRWNQYQRLITVQRIEQFHIVPDLLPALEPTADVQLYYRQRRVDPGKTLSSLVTQRAPTLRVQLFDAGVRLVTAVVVDLDVPVPEHDAFDRRVHFVAANVPLGPADSSLPLSRVAAEHVAVPWLPAHAQMGSPYHRLAVVLLRQKNDEPVDVQRVARFYADNRDGFCLQAYRARFPADPFGFTMFRSVWDEHTAEVMRRAGIRGADVQLKNVRVASLKPPKRLRGWEARRQGPKYRHLWKYTKRVRGLSNAKRWTATK